MAELSDENIKLALRVSELERALKSSQIEVASLSACLSSLSEADDTASTEEYKYKGTVIASSVVHARGSSSAATHDGGGVSGGSYSHMSDDR